jgi:predicted transcriptional regulator
MTKEYRGRHEIIEQILRTASNNDSKGAARTSIMYKSFLSHAQLKEYLSYLLENDLLEELHQKVGKSGNERIIYKITPKGLRLLQIYNEMRGLVALDEIL